MPLNKSVISKPAIYKIVQDISKVQYRSGADIVYGFTKNELKFAVDEVLMICDFHSEPPPQLQQTPCTTLRELLVQMFTKEQELFATTNNDSTSYGANMNMNAIKIVLSLIDEQKP